MQRVMTETVKDAAGAVRWRRGQMVDYPPGTWDAIASALGRGLGEFTTEPGIPGDEPKRRGRPPKDKEMSDVADAS